jgi:hypothetical protein
VVSSGLYRSSGRLAEEILERTAIASGLRRRGDYEVLALLRRAEPDRLPLSKWRSSS